MTTTRQPSTNLVMAAWRHALSAAELAVDITGPAASQPLAVAHIHGLLRALPKAQRLHVIARVYDDLVTLGSSTDPA